jgi:broad specificity phosphatase PhoE/predicted kinase
MGAMQRGRTDAKLAFVMVGLPARGKTFIGRKVARYLSWLGYHARVFNVGAYRRQRLGSYQHHSFFDQANEQGNAARLELALAALDDMLDWLRTDGEVGIYDATNSTIERRALVRARCEAAGARVVFIESICDAPAIIDANIRQTKARSPDYAGIEPEEAVRDFRMRIAHYATAYESLSEAEGSFIKIIDVGKTIIVHAIDGYVPARVVYLLSNFHLEPRSIWLTRHGESEYNVLGRIGGDAPLSGEGVRYAVTLREFLRQTIGFSPPPVVWTSTLRRTVETAEKVALPYVAWRALDEIDAGTCDGLTYAEIRERMPAEFSARALDKFHYRYPRGESYQDVIQRLEPIIFELERHREAVLIIGHQAVLRTIYAYWMDKAPEECPSIPIPLHTVIQLTPTAYGCDERRFPLPPPPLDDEGFRQPD